MDQPRCDYIPLGSTEEARWPNPASVQVFRNHNPGIDPEPRDRCLIHVRRQHGPSDAAGWDAVDHSWLAVD